MHLDERLCILFLFLARLSKPREVVSMQTLGGPQYEEYDNMITDNLSKVTLYSTFDGKLIKCLIASHNMLRGVT